MKEIRYQLNYKIKGSSSRNNKYSELIKDENIAIKKAAELKFNYRYTDVHLYEVIICKEEIQIPEKKKKRQNEYRNFLKNEGLSEEQISQQMAIFEGIEDGTLQSPQQSKE